MLGDCTKKKKKRKSKENGLGRKKKKKIHALEFQKWGYAIR